MCISITEASGVSPMWVTQIIQGKLHSNALQQSVGIERNYQLYKQRLQFSIIPRCWNISVMCESKSRFGFKDALYPFCSCVLGGGLVWVWLYGFMFKSIWIWIWIQYKVRGFGFGFEVPGSAHHWNIYPLYPLVLVLQQALNTAWCTAALEIFTHKAGHISVCPFQFSMWLHCIL